MTTRARTLTFSVVTTRKRALSLSLLGTRPPSLLYDLPAEIIIHILELALVNSRPKDLALISQFIRQFVNTIIYRIVVLDTSDTINLLYRTASSPRSSHLLTSIKRLAVTWDSKYFSNNTEQQLRQIIACCPSLRALAVPSCCQLSISPSGSLLQEGPTELTIRSFEHPSNLISSSSTIRLLPAYFSNSLTHLRICEPSDTWQSPLSMIAAFNGAPNLTHLQLVRRADSNEDNDLIFVEDIAYLLSTRKNLKVVVVSIFEALLGASPSALCESGIWVLISKLQEVDSRVVIMESELGRWKEEWKDKKGLRCGGQPINFWDMIPQKQHLD